MVQMSDEAARRVEDRFDNLSNEFDNSRTDITVWLAGLSTACGEFKGSIEDGRFTMELGYREVFEVGRVSAALIAGNTNALNVNLNALDQDLSWEPSLSDPA